jgi:hypothetical protein
LLNAFDISTAFFKLDTLDREAQKVNGTSSFHKVNVMPGLGATVIDISDTVSSVASSTLI